MNALNALLGSVEQPGGVFFTPQINLASAAKGLAGRARHRASLDKVAAGILDGSSVPQVLLLDGANPVFTARRKAGACARRSRRCPTSSASARFLDETAALSDLILPDHSFLETWVGGAA